jgi:Na+-translocating ferredoxin:NAD+ oxidoreductase RnfC subunit
MERLKLEKYDKPLPVVLKPASPNRVRIALNQHIGAPVRVLKVLGNRVDVGEKIAETKVHELGTPLHASIAGTVTDVTRAYLEITAEN